MEAGASALTHAYSVMLLRGTPSLMEGAGLPPLLALPLLAFWVSLLYEPAGKQGHAVPWEIPRQLSANEEDLGNEVLDSEKIPFPKWYKLAKTFPVRIRNKWDCLPSILLLSIGLEILVSAMVFLKMKWFVKTLGKEEKNNLFWWICNCILGKLEGQVKKILELIK